MNRTTVRFGAAAAAIVASTALALTACGDGGVPGVDMPSAAPEPQSTAANPRTDIAPPDQDPQLNPENNPSLTQGPQPSASDTPATPTAPTGEGPAPTLNLGDPTDSPTFQAPGPTPNNPIAPSATQSPEAYGILRTTDRNQWISSKVPFLAGIVNDKSTVVHFYRFERMDVDFACTAPDAIQPRNGHFVRVFYVLSNGRTPQDGPSIDVTEPTWSYQDASGQTLTSDKIVTDAARKCLKKSKNDDGQWGAVAKPGITAGGELIFDLPDTGGTLQQRYSEAMGGWRFPVENANQNFVSLDERIAERFKGRG